MYLNIRLGCHVFEYQARGGTVNKKVVEKNNTVNQLLGIIVFLLRSNTVRVISRSVCWNSPPSLFRVILFTCIWMYIRCDIEVTIKISTA